MAASDVTQLIRKWQAGDQRALEELTPFIYDELKRLALAYMRRESAGHTLQATALVNEAFLKFSDAKVDFSDRSHFVATAARTMRRVLVEHARAKRSQKRGAGQRHVTLNEDLLAERNNAAGILDVDLALDRLAKTDTRLAQSIELVFFGGLTYDEAADHMGVARTTFYEGLRFAKAWLKSELQ